MAESSRLHRRALLLTVVPGIVATMLPLILYFAWLPRLPDRLASHVGPDGTADDFVATSVYPFTIPPLTLALTALFGGITWLMRDNPQHQRMMSACGGAVSGLMLVAGFVIPWNNLDVVDPTTTRFPAWQMALLAGVTLLGAMLGWFGVGKLSGTTPEKSVPEAHQPIRELGTDEHVFWQRTVFSKPTAWILVLLLPGAVALSIASSGIALLGVVPAYVTLAAFTYAKVVVDDNGLTVRMLGGLIRVRARVPETRSAFSREINVMRDFQGVGLRSTSTATGLIFKSGSGLWVYREVKGPLAITIADADEAAGLLNGLRRRYDFNRA